MNNIFYTFIINFHHFQTDFVGNFRLAKKYPKCIATVISNSNTKNFCAPTDNQMFD